MSRLALVAVLLVVSGCATSPVPSSGSEDTVARPNGVGVEGAAAPVALPAGPVIVVLDDARSAHLEVLQVFSARLGRPYEILNLAHRSPGDVSERLSRAGRADVVAIGPSAWALAGAIQGLRVIPAGVINDDVAARGVDALPPFDVQLDYWRRANPELRRVGVVGSQRVVSRMDSLETACRDRGITLERQVVESDQESLRAFRAMVPKIDGFVFLPDESVLSPRVIRQIIAHGSQNGVQTLVYSPVMFNLGATLYVQSDPVRVAESLIELLESGTAPAIREIRVRNRLEGTLAMSSVRPERTGSGSGRVSD